MITSIFSIFLGVTYPLIIEALNGEKVSIGPPYYNTIFAPLILIASIFIMASVDSLWQRSKPISSIAFTILIPLILSIIFIYIVWHVTAIFSILPYIGIFSGLLILFSYLYRIFSNFLSKKFINTGSAIAHIGLGLLFLAVSFNSILSYEKNLNLAPGESIQIDQSIKEFSFDDIKVLKASNHDVISVEVSLVQDGKNISLNPQKRKYSTRGQITTESSIHASVLKAVSYTHLTLPTKRIV